jgi:hypothetical protein
MQLHRALAAWFAAFFNPIANKRSYVRQRTERVGVLI